jgi:hypothetical protein
MGEAKRRKLLREAAAAQGLPDPDPPPVPAPARPYRMSPLTTMLLGVTASVQPQPPMGFDWRGLLGRRLRRPERVEALQVQLARCEVTGNQCGTDTWREGFPCTCGPCQEYLRGSQL